MITKNFKAIIACLLQSSSTSGNSGGLIPVKDTSGTTQYLSSKFSAFPYTVGTTVRISTGSQSGIWLVTGTTQPTENDYNLESRITSGLSASTPTITYGVDISGNPYKELLFTLTNTTSSDISISEIGFFQESFVAATQGAIPGSSATAIMLDRTVLSTPVTVPANDSAAIKYTLKTVMPS